MNSTLKYYKLKHNILVKNHFHIRLYSLKITYAPLYVHNLLTHFINQNLQYKHIK